MLGWVVGRLGSFCTLCVLSCFCPQRYHGMVEYEPRSTLCFHIGSSI